MYFFFEVFKISKWAKSVPLTSIHLLKYGGKKLSFNKRIKQLIMHATQLVSNSSFLFLFSQTVVKNSTFLALYLKNFFEGMF